MLWDGDWVAAKQGSKEMSMAIEMVCLSLQSRCSAGLAVLCLASLILVISGCQPGSTPTPTPPAAPEEKEIAEQEIALKLTSTAFVHEASIPSKYTCDGEDVSPLLEWSDLPTDAQTFAIIMDDPDAPVGTWVHWVLYDLPAETRMLPEAVPSGAELPDGSRHGENSWGRTGYGGPCPPSGVHRYFFKLYALDVALDLDAGATKEELLQAMEGHMLAQTELMGTYTRE
jgi:Raf kinase inhibitor-like YbhB/YbcL family protein